MTRNCLFFNSNRDPVKIEHLQGRAAGLKAALRLGFEAVKWGERVARHIRRSDGRWRLAVSTDFEQHRAAHPDVTDDLLAEAFERINVATAGREITEAVNLGRPLGVTSKVQTEPATPDASCLFAYRHGRRHPSRTIVGVEKPVTSRITIVAERGFGPCFVLRTAYLGEYAPPEPTSYRAIRRRGMRRAEALAFWCRHALVYDPVEFASAPFEATWAGIIGQIEADRMARKRQHISGPASATGAGLVPPRLAS
ncbi:hypothetical protein [Inquilinus sp. Marseille-Q2685]|uniref:hypothetical protein n=1 Tax=Inquilinus sp. Marseille-Q2685 TaxID=2866581 RepID=UPI001CE3F499|nr:hypothetical protein [Inquilinus sp. Marseille-Q2685]